MGLWRNEEGGEEGGRGEEEEGEQFWCWEDQRRVYYTAGYNKKVWLISL